MPPLGKLPSVANRRRHCGGHYWPVAFDLRQLLTLRILSKDAPHPTVRIGHTLVERNALVIHLSPPFPAQGRQGVAFVLYDHRGVLPQSRDPMGDNDAPLSE